MRIDKTLMRLGGVAVSAAVVTALAPAVAGHAGPAPVTPSAASTTASVSASPTSTATPSAAGAGAADPSLTASGGTPSAAASSPAAAPSTVSPSSSSAPSATPTTASARPSITAGTSGRRTLAAATTPNLTSAVSYLVSTTGANGLSGGTSLARDGYYELFGGFADFGLTMDGAFALAATHTNQAALEKTVTFLRSGKDGSGRDIDAYTGFGTSSADGGPSGGALAKEALLAEVTGYDPRTFGGHDLIAALDASRCSAAASLTQCAAADAFDNSETTFDQSLAVLAQLRASDNTAAASSFTYLVSQQHPDGSFSAALPASTDEDVDSTGMAVMALALVATDPAATVAQKRAAATAVSDADAWLASTQGTNGGWSSGVGVSTNSTALALQALQLDPDTYAMQLGAGRTFLATQQDADGGFTIAAGQPGSDVRASTQVVGGVVGTTFGTLSDDVASHAATTGSASKAAAWLVTQLSDGNHLQDTYEGTVYPDYGGTADVAIALASTGTQDATLVKTVRYLEANVDGYADPKGTEGGPFSGSLGKLALVAEITGQNPRAFGGYDLLTLLTSNVCTAAIAGDYSPCTATGDFANAFSPVSQALDVLALERGGVTVPPTALARLLSLECPDGGFSATLITAGQTCTSDADTTGYAEQALVLDPAASAPVLAASQYLLATQLADGGWYGSSSASATDANANSTALALGALLAAPPAAAAAPLVAGRGNAPRLVSQPAVNRGQSLLAVLQHTDGALQVSPAAKPAADDVLATDQSVPSIAGKTLTTLLHPVSLAVVTTSPTPSTTATAISPTVTPTTPVATISHGPAPTAGGTLPFTGANASLWSQLAALLLVLGAGLLVAGTALRRRGAHR